MLLLTYESNGSLQYLFTYLYNLVYNLVTGVQTLIDFLTTPITDSINYLVDDVPIINKIISFITGLIPSASPLDLITWTGIILILTLLIVKKIIPTA